MMGSDGGMFFGGMFMWLFWLLIIAAIFVVIKAMLGSGSSAGTSKESPMDILQKRYARGEISEEQFIEQRKVIENK